MPADIKHIVFDIGKVLIHYDPTIPFQRIIPDAQERGWFFAKICTHDWNLEQDRGRPWADAEAQLIALHPDREHQIRAFRKSWHEMVPHPYEESVAILEALIDRGYDVTMLTNFASDTFREAQERFPFLKASRGVTVSGDIKKIKPDLEIYVEHAESFGLDPQSTLFIDDSQANVEGARAAGWNAVLFTGAEKLREDLKSFGIDV